MNGLMKLDRIDINILVQLQKDGRISNVNLADAVGLSPSPCLQRVKRLEQAGFITGYEAHINLTRITDSVRPDRVTSVKTVTESVMRVRLMCAS